MVYEDPRVTELNRWLDAQVGVHEGRDPDGNWNNIQPYSAMVGQPNGVAWCQIFAAAGNKQAGLGAFFPNNPWVPAALQWGYAHGYVSEYPAIGADIEFGGGKHYGKCRWFDATTITTVEGNTNNNPQETQGDGVYRKSYLRTDPWVDRYIYPNPSTGVILESADPAYNRLPEVVAAKAKGTVVTALPMLLDTAFDFRCVDQYNPDGTIRVPKITPKELDGLISQAKSQGYKGFLCYLGPDATKVPQPWMVAQILYRGMGLGFQYEHNTMDAFAGKAAGAAAANLCLSQLASFNAPKGAAIPVFGTCDNSSATVAQVAPFFSGFVPVIRADGFMDGIYGNGDLCAAALATLRWMPETWAHGHVGVAHLIQKVNNVPAHPAGTDCNVVAHGFRLWTAVVAAQPIPVKPNPAADQQVALVKHYAANLGSLYPSGTPRGDAARHTITDWKAVA